MTMRVRDRELYYIPETWLSDREKNSIKED
jgi:hypothetical protein